jgi:hypothetical protein
VAAAAFHVLAVAMRGKIPESPTRQAENLVKTNTWAEQVGQLEIGQTQQSLGVVDSDVGTGGIGGLETEVVALLD